MTDETRELVKSALFEAAFVVLGVVLALAANEWRQDLANRQHARAAVATILEELESNRAAVASAREYHRGLLDSLRSPREDGWSPDLELFSRGFVSPANLYHTAWETASETGALGHADYDHVLALSRVYSEQERYRQQAASIGQLIYGELLRGGTEAVTGNYGNLAHLIGAFAYRESQLLELYDATFAALGESR